MDSNKNKFIAKDRFISYLTKVKGYHTLWQDLDSAMLNITSKTIDSFITESYPVLMDMLAIIDDLLDTPKINRLDNLISKEITKICLDNPNSLQFVSGLVISWCLDYNYGEDWPEEGIKNVDTDETLHLRTMEDLYEYLYRLS